MKAYKLTDKNGQTKNSTQWGPGITHEAPGAGQLCSDGWIHVYDHPELAVTLDPIGTRFGKKIVERPLFKREEAFVPRQQLEYNFFHLWTANREEMRCWRYDGAVNVTRGAPGVNVLTNQGFNEDGDPKGLAVRRIVRPSDIGEIDRALKAVETALRYRGDDAEVCNHGAIAGTVSSSILALHADNSRENVLLFVDGLPCQAPFRDRSSLIR